MKSIKNEYLKNNHCEVQHKKEDLIMIVMDS
jgi:hypothetical protein